MYNFLKKIYEWFTYTWKETDVLFPGEYQIISILFSALDKAFPHSGFSLENKRFRRFPLGVINITAVRRDFDGYYLQIGPVVSINSELGYNYISPDIKFTTVDSKSMSFSFGIDSLGDFAYLKFSFNNRSHNYRLFSLWQVFDIESVCKSIESAVSDLLTNCLYKGNKENVIASIADSLGININLTTMDFNKVRLFNPVSINRIQQIERDKDIIFPEDYIQFLLLTNGLIIFDSDSDKYPMEINGIPIDDRDPCTYHYYGLQLNKLIELEIGQKYWELLYLDGTKYLMKVFDIQSPTAVSQIYVVSMDDCEIHEEETVTLKDLVIDLLRTDVKSQHERQSL